MTRVYTHAKVTTGTVDNTVEVDLADWNDAHVGTGTWDAAELNANVVQAVVNDTNVHGAIAAQTLTFSWSGTLSAARLNANVAQAVTNDTNVTGSITAQNLTLGWTGTLAAARGGFGADVSASNGVPLFATGVATFTGTSGSGNFVRVTSATLVTPTLGAALATSINGNTFTTGTYTLTGAAGKTFTFSNTLTLAGTDGTTMTFPTTNATIARTDVGQTFTGAQLIGGALTVQTGSTAAFAASANGTNPALQVDTSTASQVAGLKVTGAATGGTVALAAIDTGSNTNLSIDAKGAGTITLGGTSTGATIFTRATTFSAAITYGGVTLSNAVTGTGNMVLATSPTLTTPLLGTPTSGTLTNCTGLPLSTGVTGAGTGVLTALAVNTGTAGSVIVNGGALGTPSSGTATSLTGLPLTTGVTGVLPKANGGTGTTAESWQYIETLTASSSATLTTSTFTSAFDDYAFVFGNIVPATDSVNFNATVESGGSFQATTYLNVSAATTSLDLEAASTLSNSAGKGYCGTLYFTSVNSTSVNKFITGRCVYAITTTFVPTAVNVNGYWNGGQGAITRVRFQMGSGNISTGTIKVYGLRNS